MKFTLNYRLLLAGTILLTACQKDISSKNKNDLLSAGNKSNQSEKYNTFKGPEVQMGDGKARSWITISHTGVPSEIGIELTAGAFSGLSANPMDFEHNTFVLPLHQKAREATPFEHLVVDWNPGGHPGEEYFVPHFDFHFYMVPLAERLAVTPASPLMEELPPVQYWPQGFVATPGGVPQMGKHWINPLSPEYSGAPFTHTFIYGSYAGKFTFVEPMVTLQFIKDGTLVSMPYGQPTQFQQTNTYYPSTYNLYWQDGKYYITLSNFSWH